MNAHTPGPWTVEPLQWDHGASIAIVAAGGEAYIVATIAPENEEDEPDMYTAKRGPCDKANAQLMAACPEMIYALELADAELSKMGCECDCENLPIRCPVCAVKAALAKTKEVPANEVWWDTEAKV